MAFLYATIHRLDDSELVDRFKRGDRAAFAELVRRYQDRVYTLAYRWMGDEQVAREIAQDVFLALYRSLGGFRGEAKLSTWIARVVVNHCKNRRLYRQRRHFDRHEPLEGSAPAGDPPRELPHPGPPTDASAHRSEARSLLQDALDRLTPEQRAILVLRDVDDRDYDEIAQILAIPRGTVKSRLHRARAALARELAQRLDPSDVV